MRTEISSELLRLSWSGAVIMLAFGVLSARGSASEQTISVPSIGQSELAGPGRTPDGVNPEAWTRMIAQVRAQSYAIYPDKQRHGTWLANNPAQQFGVRFAPDSVSFSARNPVKRARAGVSTHRSMAPMDLAFDLRTRVGDAKSQPIAPVVSGNRVEYRHPTYTEWYVNDAKGFEQGWTLNKRMANGKAAHLRIDVSGARTVAEGEDAVRIEDLDGKLGYRYAGLKAWDADHRAIPATLRVSQPGRIDVTFEDLAARYPITVDPTLTATQEAVLSEPSTDGFGGTVAVDGDTVIVSENGEVFIFSRNQGGAGAWGLAHTLSDPGADELDQFGINVAINGDTVVVAGSALNNQTDGLIPAFFIYERNLGGAAAWGLSYTYSFSGTGEPPFEFYTVAVSGNTVIVGPYRVNYESSSNVVSMFERLNGVWSAATTLVNPQASLNSGVNYSCFGCALALNGSTLVVGAYGAGNPKTGFAYIYTLAPGGAWQLATTLSGSQTNSRFGESVAVNGDTVAVGSGAGAGAYIYGRNQGGIAGSWGLAKTLSNPGAGASDDFGYAVAVEGDFLVVGAYGANTQAGAAYLFERNQGGAGTWGLSATMNGPANGAELGTSLALSGNTLVAGTRYFEKAYVYDLSGGSVTTEAAIADPSKATAPDQVGCAVAANGDVVVVGACGASNSQGKAYIFERNAGSTGAWGLTVTLTDPAATANDMFGQAVSVDGNTLVVGSPGTGASTGDVHIYDRNKNGLEAWGLVQSIGYVGSGSLFGHAVSVNGNTLAVASYASSAGGGNQVFIFERNSAGTFPSTPVSLADPGSASDVFGASVALYGDTLIVGDPYRNSFQGAAYIYNRNQGGAGTWGILTTLLDPTATVGDSFGSNVSVNGGTAVVASPGYSGFQGRAYVYDNIGTGWNATATLQDPLTTGNSDDFGNAVAISGDTIVVGAKQSGTGGAAYVYNRNQGGNSAWGLTATQTDPGAASGDGYGNAVAVDGETAVIGAPQINTGNGAAYILGLQQGAAKDASIVWSNTNGQEVLWNMNGAAIATAPNLGTVPAGWSVVGEADFNGDGNPDLLWRNTSGAVVVWFTNGTTVTSSLNLGTIPLSWSVAGTGDFNLDGNADILWRNSGGDTVIWFMNGSGIASSTDLGTIATSWSVAGVGDFNGDGKADILWRNSSGDDVIWFMNAGKITSSSDLGVIASTWKVVGTGDFNGDGHRDILWRNSNGDVVIWFMNGGTISSSTDLGVVASAWSVAGTGDFDGNGKSDILWRNSNGDTVIWFMNGGAIASSADLGVVNGGWSVAGVAGH